jgi:hypothetical protein
LNPDWKNVRIIEDLKMIENTFVAFQLTSRNFTLGSSDSVLAYGMRSDTIKIIVRTGATWP